MKKRPFKRKNVLNWDFLTFHEIHILDQIFNLTQHEREVQNLTILAPGGGGTKCPDPFSYCDCCFLGAKAPLGLAYVKRGVMKKFLNSIILMNSTHRMEYCWYCQILDTWYSISDICYLILNIWYIISETRCSILNIWYLIFYFNYLKLDLINI